MTAAGGEITQMLQEWRAGDSAGLDRLLARLYDELRQTAHRERLRLGGRSAPLETTVLVHETYLRLARAEPGAVANREHFLAIASRAMRQLLIDELRRRGRQKRGKGQGEETLPEWVAGTTSGIQPEFFLDLERALAQLEASHPRVLQVLECRLFGGLSDEEIAVALDVSSRTAHRDWIKARAWLQIELKDWSAERRPAAP